MASGANITFNGGKLLNLTNGTLLTDPMTVRQGQDKANKSEAILKSGGTMLGALNVVNGTGQAAASYAQMVAMGLGVPSIVTVGDGPEYDIDIDTSSTTEGHVITDAINLLMTRTDNNGGTIYIGPYCIDNTDGPVIYINHANGASAPLNIIGSGPGWYKSTRIKSPEGFMIGRFGNQSDGIVIENMELDGVDSTGTGIDCNISTMTGPRLRDIRLVHYKNGVMLNNPRVYGARLEFVTAVDCSDYGIYVGGNANYLESCRVGWYGHGGIYIEGLMNTLVNIDLGTAGDGGRGFGSGLWIVGSQNTVLSAYADEQATETNVVNISGSNNYLRIGVTDGTAPYGKIRILDYSKENYIDQMALSDSPLNITIGTGAFWNRIRMHPQYQTASKSVITDSSGSTMFDYGSPTASAAPGAGYWYRGAVVMDVTPVSGQPMGWICSATGSPGTWKDLSNVA